MIVTEQDIFDKFTSDDIWKTFDHDRREEREEKLSARRDLVALLQAEEDRRYIRNGSLCGSVS